MLAERLLESILATNRKSTCISIWISLSPACEIDCFRSPTTDSTRRDSTGLSGMEDNTFQLALPFLGPDVLAFWGPDVLALLAPNVLAFLGPDVLAFFGPDVLAFFGPDVLALLCPDVRGWKASRTPRHLVLARLVVARFVFLEPDVLGLLGPDVLEQTVTDLDIVVGRFRTSLALLARFFFTFTRPRSLDLPLRTFSADARVSSTIAGIAGYGSAIWLMISAGRTDSIVASL